MDNQDMPLEEQASRLSLTIDEISSRRAILGIFVNGGAKLSHLLSFAPPFTIILMLIAENDSIGCDLLMRLLTSVRLNEHGDLLLG